jgi:ankyrin repeat protein
MSHAKELQTPRLTQPEGMRTKRYVYGVEPVNGYDAWALFVASATGDVAGAKRLLAKDCGLANAQYWYQFPIHLAVLAGHARVVKLLLDEGANTGESRFTYNSWDKLLQCAKERGHTKIERLLERAMRKRFGYAPEFEVLKAAIIARNRKRIEAVLRRRPELAKASDALGNSPLHWSVITRQPGLIDRFVELGTPVDAVRADGQTPVLLAVCGMDYWYRETRGRSHPSLRNRWVMVGQLLAKGAEYTITVAAAVGDLERVTALLKRDKSLAWRLDSARVSALSYAASEGYLHIVRFLLERGAKPNQPEESAPNGLALFAACQGNHLEIARLLLEHGADPNAGSDSSGCCLTICEVCHGERAKPLQKLLRQHGAQTPPYAMNRRELRQAIRKRGPAVRHEEFLRCIMETGDVKLLQSLLRADPSAAKRVSSGECPKSPGMMKLLLAHGADPDNPDWLGRTFLHYCTERGYQSVAAVLLKAGADPDAQDLEGRVAYKSSSTR